MDFEKEVLDVMRWKFKDDDSFYTRKQAIIKKLRNCYDAGLRAGRDEMIKRFPSDGDIKEVCYQTMLEIKNSRNGLWSDVGDEDIFKSAVNWLRSKLLENKESV